MVYFLINLIIANYNFTRHKMILKLILSLWSKLIMLAIVSKEFLVAIYKYYGDIDH